MTAAPNDPNDDADPPWPPTPPELTCPQAWEDWPYMDREQRELLLDQAQRREADAEVAT